MNLNTIGVLMQARLEELNEMCYQLELASKKQDQLLMDRNERILELEKAIKELLKYFTSGNSIEVERATILTASKEIQRLKELL
jgi:hypothetical protein